jgi:predicted HicB family RNase H-like nuclease
MGRPRTHDGDVPIIIRINKRLLEIIDYDAKAEGISRNTVITRELAKVCADQPPCR